MFSPRIIMKSILIAVSLGLACISPICTYAQANASNESEDSPTAEEFEHGELISESAEEDENPELRQGAILIADDDDDIDIPVPAFINAAENRITLNGADWTGLRKAANSYKLRPLSIINIGDSHIQANIGTAVTRELLQYKFGNAGRGIITPLKMSGTNQPADYVFSSDQPYTAVKLMKAPWKMTMGFTGTSVSPTTKSSSITVGTRSDDDYNPFSSITLFHKGQMKVTRVTDEKGADVMFTHYPSRDYTYVKLGAPQTRVTVHYDNLGDLTLFGANLSGERPGVFYHSIGNNGATFDTYNRIGDMGVSLYALHPNLVILSLGTNEAFGRLDTARFRASMDKLVKNIRAANPEAQILLVTPMECHRTVTKNVTKRVRTKARRTKKGKRIPAGTKTVTSKVRTSGINSSIRPIRDAIMAYGRDNNIAVYDFWAVAGGEGASNTWINNGLFSGDKIHHSAKGYRLEGRLMYDAIMDALAGNVK